MRRGTTRTAVVTCLLVAAPLLPQQGYAAESPVAAKPAAACQTPGQKTPYVSQTPIAHTVLGVDRVWPLATGKGVTVAVLDTGVDVQNGQLNDAGKVGRGADFLRKKSSGRYDCHGHGTAVASLIAGEHVDGYAFRGLAHEATILPVVVSDKPDEVKNTSESNPRQVARAVNWAVGHGAEVIHISVTYYRDDPALRRAISGALARNVVVVASAGNGKPEDPTLGDGPPYPAAYPGVIGVAAVDFQTRPLSRSPWRDTVDLAAPGDELLAANRPKGHIQVSGSGFATAFVSATAALVRSRWPHLTANEVQDRLFATASPAAGSTSDVGHGMVDPYRALTESLSGDAPVTPSADGPPAPDPAELARQQEWQRIGNVGLTVAAVGLVLAVIMLTTLTLLPKGFRRGWRPGRARSFPKPKDDGDLPPAPVKLFEDLERE